MTEVTRGKLIVVEGIDGSGLTTQAERLTDALNQLGYAAYATKEPTPDGAVGKLIRSILQHNDTASPQQLALLFAADRVAHCEALEVGLAHGAWIICDRYVLSSYVYQSLDGCSLDWLKAINGQALAADLTIFLDVPPREAAQRRAQRGAAQELFETNDMTSRSYSLFNQLLTDGDKIGETFVVRGLGTEEEVTDRLVEAVRRHQARQEARVTSKLAAKEHAIQELRKAFGN